MSNMQHVCFWLSVNGACMYALGSMTAWSGKLIHVVLVGVVASLIPALFFWATQETEEEKRHHGRT